MTIVAINSAKGKDNHTPKTPILLDKINDKVYLIDFEYGGTNYRGFDIANHWNEWAGGTQTEMNGVCEYQRFPSDLAQMKFCKAYLNEQNVKNNVNNNVKKDDTVNNITKPKNKKYFLGLF